MPDTPRTTSARLSDDARQIFGDAVRAVQVDALLGHVDWGFIADRSLDAYNRIVLLAAGKAALPMARVTRAMLGEHVDPSRIKSLTVVPTGYAKTATHAGGDVIEAGHPVPNAASAEAARRALSIVRAADERTLFIALISGGASSLWSLAADGLELADLQATVQVLLHAGATIHELNTVRKHLSAIAGGRLADAARQASMCALVLSDVVGDDPSVIGSGPTVHDSTTPRDALDVLRTYTVLDVVPAAVRAHLERAMVTGSTLASRRKHVRTTIIGRNADALTAASESATRLGYRVHLNDTPRVGEARDAGRALARELLASRGANEPTCALCGGETTVTVRGTGRGGRNQEVALAAALAFEEADTFASTHDVVLLSGGTDGIDGPTDAAGGIVSSGTACAIRDRGLDPDALLANNDAYRALDAVDALLRTGPTHTNVMDVQIGLTAELPS